MVKIERPECPNSEALKTNYKHLDNKKALITSSFGKCMYCESKIEGTQFGDVEHIKPKSKYRDLEFNWNNLGFVCTKCNNKKLDRFFDQLPFVNPYNEEPDNFFYHAGPMLLNFLGNARGEITLKTIGLNRIELVEDRMIKLKDLNELIERYHTSEGDLKEALKIQLEKEFAPKKEFSKCKKHFIQQSI